MDLESVVFHSRCVTDYIPYSRESLLETLPEQERKKVMIMRWNESSLETHQLDFFLLFIHFLAIDYWYMNDTDPSV